MKHTLLILTFVTVFPQEIVGIQCYCEGHFGVTCIDGYCESTSYCMKTWILANSQVRDRGCQETFADLSELTCQTNRKGLVSCFCNTDKCNDDSFEIPTDVVLTVPPVMKCFEDDLNEDNYCYGHYCIYERDLTRNEFGDVFPRTAKPRRGCSDPNYTQDLSRKNMCKIENDWLQCICDTEFCNREQNIEVPLGNVICYLSKRDQSERTKYCIGQKCYLFYEDINNVKEKGCSSVNDEAPEEEKRLGKLGYYTYCDENLCNGDLLPSIE